MPKNRSIISKAHRFPNRRTLGTLIALGAGIACFHGMDSTDEVTKSSHVTDHKVDVKQAAPSDQSLSEKANSPTRPNKQVNPFKGTPLEKAIAVAREIVKNSGKDSFGENGSRTFGNDPANQVTVRALADGKVSLGPAGTNPKWGFIMADESVSDPVGYETIKAQPDLFNLMGTRLFSAPVARNIFGTISGNTLTDSNRDFDAILSSGVPYAVELESGARNGKVLKITSVSGSQLTVGESLPAESGVNYTVRRMRNLSDLFGNIPDLVKVADFNPDTGDLILVPSGDGHFDRYFLSSYPGLEGFFNATTGLAEDPHLLSTEGLLFLRRGATPLDIVVSGSVKLTDTLLNVADTFNYFSSIYPAGATLGESNLEASLKAGTAETADLVWLEAGPGTFQQYFYSNGTPPLTVGWRRVGAGDLDQADASFDSNRGFAIHRRAATGYDALLTPPAFYSDL